MSSVQMKRWAKALLPVAEGSIQEAIGDQGSGDMGEREVGISIGSCEALDAGFSPAAKKRLALIQIDDEESKNPSSTSAFIQQNNGSKRLEPLPQSTKKKIQMKHKKGNKVSPSSESAAIDTALGQEKGGRAVSNPRRALHESQDLTRKEKLEEHSEDTGQGYFLLPHQKSSEDTASEDTVQQDSWTVRTQLELPEIHEKYDFNEQEFACFCCSAEGDTLDYFKKFVRNCAGIRLKQGQSKESLVLKEHAKFVYGGNRHNETVGNAEVSHLLLNLKKKEKERVFLLVGNRDVIKAQMAATLNYLMQQCTDKKEEKKTTEFFWRAISEIVRHEIWFQPISHQELGHDDAKRLAWMVDIVLGQAGKFERKRYEEERKIDVDLTLEKSCFNAMIEFKEEIKQKSEWMEDYLKNCDLMHVMDEYLFVHAGVTSENLKCVPQRRNDDIVDNNDIVDAKDWAKKLNDWLKTLNWSKSTFLSDEKDESWKWDESDETSKYWEGDKSIVSLGQKVEAENCALGEKDKKWLVKVGISCVVSGYHHVLGDCPRICKSKYEHHEILQIMCNTNMGRHSASRGGKPVHACDVILFKKGHVFVQGTAEKLSGGMYEIEYMLKRDERGIYKEGVSFLDCFVGEKVKRGDSETFETVLVRAKLKDKQNEESEYLIQLDFGELEVWPKSKIKPDSKQKASKEAGEFASGSVVHPTLGKSLQEIAKSLKKYKCPKYVPQTTSWLLKMDPETRRQKIDSEGDACKNEWDAYVECRKGFKHVKAREPNALLSRRLEVLDEQVDWKADWKPSQVDWKECITQSDWKEYDSAVKNHLTAGITQNHTSASDEIRNQEKPKNHKKNPCGRTGLVDRGVLHDWGPNFAIDACITRTEPRTEPGTATKSGTGSQRTQVLVCCPSRSRGSADANVGLPGEMLKGKKYDEYENMIPDEKYKLIDFLKSILKGNIKDSKEYEETAKEIDGCFTFEKGRMVYPDGTTSDFDAPQISENQKIDAKRKHDKYKTAGYCDDSRNTDDAWICTQVWHFHLRDEISKHLNINELKLDRKGAKFQVPPLSPMSSCFFLGVILISMVLFIRRNRARIIQTQIVEYLMKFTIQWLVVDSGLPEFNNLFASHKFFVNLCVPKCQCGRRRYDKDEESHRDDESHLQIEDEKSCDKPDFHKVSSGGDTGMIEFIGKSSMARYIRGNVEDDNDARLVKECLLLGKMPPPQVVVSLTGSDHDFERLKAPDMQRIFQKGILRAAKSMRAVIVTGGTDAGVMKYIGQAANEVGNDNGHGRVPLLGIAPWGAVIGRSALQSRGPERMPYIKTQPNSDTSAGLEGHHGFFVLVDDGTVNKFGADMKGRAHIESVLCESFPQLKLDLCPRCPRRCEDPMHKPEDGEVNSISFQERERFEVVRAYIKRRADMKRSVQTVECKKCKEIILAADITSEELVQCPGLRSDNTKCEHLIFGSRAKTLRRAGYSTIQCDNCLSCIDLTYFDEPPKLDLCPRCPRRCEDPMHEPEDGKLNSITFQERESFEVVRAYVKRRAYINRSVKNVACINEKCKEIFKESDITSEELLQCPGLRSDNTKCEHLIFGSRAKTLRRAGYSTIQCDNCLSCIDLTYFDEPPKLDLCPRCPRRCEDPMHEPEDGKLNSITFQERESYEVARAYIMQSIGTRTSVECKKCNEIILAADVTSEELLQCPGPRSGKCEHLIFGSRAKTLRRAGYSTIQCDNCLSRIELRNLLGEIVPRVLVVVKGGCSTMDAVSKSNIMRVDENQEEDDTHQAQHKSTGIHPAQQKSTGIPIVVAEGSGGSADFIAYVWKHLHLRYGDCGEGCEEGNAATYQGIPTGPRKKPFCKEFFAEPGKLKGTIMMTSTDSTKYCYRTRAEYKRIFGIEEDIDKFKKKDRIHISKMLDVCRRKEAVTVFDLNLKIQSQDLSGKYDACMCMDYYIMKAVCCGTLIEGSPLSIVERLQLAIDWDRQGSGTVAKDMASRELLDEDLFGFQASRENLVNALMYALKSNSPRFAELLHNVGVRIPNTEVIIKGLYPKAIEPSNSDTVVGNSLFRIMTDPEIKKETQNRLLRSALAIREIAKQDRELSKRAIKRLVEPKDMLKDGKEMEDFYEQLLPPEGGDGEGKANRIADWKKWLAGVRGMFKKKEQTFKFVNHKFKSEHLGTYIHIQVVMEHLGGWQALRLPIFEQVLDDEIKACHDDESDMKKLQEYLDAVSGKVDKQASQELYLWAVLTGKSDLAELYWRESTAVSHEHCLTRALFACALARKIAQHHLVEPLARKQLVGDRRFRETLRDNLASRFEQIAVECLDFLFKIDQEAAADALVLKWVTPNCWFQVKEGKPEFFTPLSLAALAGADRFVDHPAFQMALDRLWYGYLVTDIRETSPLSLLIPFSEYSHKHFLQTCFLIAAAVFPPLCLCLASPSSLHDRVPETEENGHHCKNEKNHRDPLSVMIVRQIKKLVAFYKAPVVNFYITAVSYCCFIIFYTLVGLFMAKDYSTSEGILHVWILTALISTARHGISARKLHLELIMYILYLIPFCVRMFELSIPERLYQYGFYRPETLSSSNLEAETAAHDGTSVYSRVVYRQAFEDFLRARSLHGILGILFWICFLDMCRVSAILGPLIIVMVKMSKDVMKLVFISLIFIIAFGSAFICSVKPLSDPPVICQGGLMHGRHYDSVERCVQDCGGECSLLFFRYFSDMVYFTFRPMLGELDENELHFSDMVDPNTGHLYDANRRVGSILFVAYLIISAVMLLNLLIAMMNSTYLEVQERSRLHARSGTSLIIIYYANKMEQGSGLPPPFSIFSDIRALMLYLHGFIHTPRKDKIPLPSDRPERLHFLEKLKDLWADDDSEWGKGYAASHFDLNGGWMGRFMVAKDLGDAVSILLGREVDGSHSLRSSGGMDSYVVEPVSKKKGKSRKEEGMMTAIQTARMMVSDRLAQKHREADAENLFQMNRGVHRGQDTRQTASEPLVSTTASMTSALKYSAIKR